MPFEVDHATLRAAAKDVHATRDDVASNLTQLRGVTNELVASWKGNASGGFNQVMQRWDTDAGKLLAALGNIADLLDKSATTHQVDEEQQTQAMNKYGAALNG